MEVLEPKHQKCYVVVGDSGNCGACRRLRPALSVMSQQMQKGVTARLSASKDWYQLASLSPSFTHFVTLHLIQVFDFYNITTFDLIVCLEPKLIATIQGSYCYSPRRRITVTVAATHLARDPTLANTDASMQEDGCTSARSSSCLTGPAHSADSTRALLFMASSSHRRGSQRIGPYPTTTSRKRSSPAPGDWDTVAGTGPVGHR